MTFGKQKFGIYKRVGNCFERMASASAREEADGVFKAFAQTPGMDFVLVEGTILDSTNLTPKDNA